MSKNRARISILSELLSFPTINQKDWDSFSEEYARVGDLVSLSSAPESKWYLSWVVDIDGSKGYMRYLLESIEDESLCWWENVGLNIYNREKIKDRSIWKWTDDQFTFYDRWLKVARKNDAYMVMPRLPKFNEDGSVEMSVYRRHDFESKFSNNRVFEKWKKVTMKVMDEYYKDSVKIYNEWLDSGL